MRLYVLGWLNMMSAVWWHGLLLQAAGNATACALIRSAAGN